MITEITVSSLDGLYDEQEVAKLDGGFCLFNIHKFVNKYRIVGENPSGAGYISSCFRLCSRCGKEDCHHIWSEQFEYEIPRHKYYSVVYRVNKCGKCGRRILCGSFGWGKSSPDVPSLVAEVTGELGFSLMFGGEFYTGISAILEEGGREQAKAAIRSAFLTRRLDGDIMRGAGY